MTSSTGSACGLDPSLIRLRGVSRTYETDNGTVWALRDVDLDVFAGEMVAIVGPSGSGKSTCANIIGCLDTQTSGTYRLAEHDVTMLGPEERALLRRHFFAFVFQGYNLIAQATAVENVALPLLYRSVPRAERLERAHEALAAVGLAAVASHRPFQLSGGQQQRVAIARALVTAPRLVIADEPTAALDPDNTRAVIESLARLSVEAGITVLIVTHDPVIAGSVHRTIAFANGQVVSGTSQREAR